MPTGLAAVRPAPTREAAGGMSVSSVAHSSNHASNYTTTDRSVSNNNIVNNTGNTSIVLL